MSCNLFALPPEQMRHKLDVLRRHCDDEGRDYDRINKTMLSMSDPFTDTDAFVAEMRVFAEMGVDAVYFVPLTDPVEYAKRLGDVGARLKEL